MSQPICIIADFGAGVSMGVARSFGKEGYSLALIARNLEKMEVNAKELRQLGYMIHPDAIAQSYMTLHKQPPEKFEAEIIYQ